MAKKLNLDTRKRDKRGTLRILPGNSSIKMLEFVKNYYYLFALNLSIKLSENIQG
jgi:hypothetical protein